MTPLQRNTFKFQLSLLSMLRPERRIFFVCRKGKFLQLLKGKETGLNWRLILGFSFSFVVSRLSPLIGDLCSSSSRQRRNEKNPEKNRTYDLIFTSAVSLGLQILKIVGDFERIKYVNGIGIQNDDRSTISSPPPRGLPSSPISFFLPLSPVNSCVFPYSL